MQQQVCFAELKITKLLLQQQQLLGKGRERSLLLQDAHDALIAAEGPRHVRPRQVLELAGLPLAVQQARVKAECRYSLFMFNYSTCLQQHCCTAPCCL
jgi:hypothetical protein